MIVNSIYADGYKNLKQVSISLDPKMNIICGENAQGKTNLIEAVWLCSGCRSFRGTRDRDMICFEGENARVSVNFQNSVRMQNIEFILRKTAVKDKTITLNGIKNDRLSKLFEAFKCVVFTPEDLNITKGSPDNRRNFLDIAISQIKPSYISALKKYNSTLQQRNSLLKSMSAVAGSDTKYLDVWNEQIADAGAYISVLRHNYCKTLNEQANRLYTSITDSKENLQIYYQSTIYENLEGETDFKGKLANMYIHRLKETAENDKKLGYTGLGVHRDDMHAFVNGVSLRDFGSQGQSRSAALALKLAHAKILKAEQGEYPVMLLDDVLSELDASRQKFILNNIDGMQVIITCCDSRPITDLRDGRVFTVKDGRIE
ncbi:MAG: DNA replication/repair protein RecF [Ruminococcus sp.]|nr:DNA replication/repair protein RecF [Ruminococcus sp.]MCM1382115.1 DNA replication/repair protein RecF [Muribaculaceae bacterium]MCM1478696.1 DNA replication/repair protein RecF [Muribaculaceae bacterium]